MSGVGYKWQPLFLTNFLYLIHIFKKIHQYSTFNLKKRKLNKKAASPILVYCVHENLHTKDRALQMSPASEPFTTYKLPHTQSFARIKVTLLHDLNSI